MKRKGSNRPCSGFQLGYWFRTRGSGHKLRQRKVQLNMRKNFFPLRVTEPWPRLPREVVESPSVEIFQTLLDKSCAAALGDPASAGGWAG